MYKRQVEKRRQDKCPDEVTVVFPTKEIRDVVRGKAANLALLPKDVKAGIRLEVPDFLQENFKALEQIGYRIKRNNPEARRNIIFDDARHDLALDVKAGSDVEWCRILPENAKQARRRVPRSAGASSSSFQRLFLDTDGISSLIDSDPEEDDEGDEHAGGTDDEMNE